MGNYALLIIYSCVGSCNYTSRQGHICDDEGRIIRQMQFMKRQTMSRYSVESSLVAQVLAEWNAQINFLASHLARQRNEYAQLVIVGLASPTLYGLKNHQVPHFSILCLSKGTTLPNTRFKTPKLLSNVFVPVPRLALFAPCRSQIVWLLY